MNQTVTTSLRTAAEIEAAGRALVADWLPLTDDDIRDLAPLVAPALRRTPTQTPAAGGERPGLVTQRGGVVKHHPVADLFPMLPEDELRDMAADIAERGLLQPIVLDAEGRILDGRNRYAACEMAGIEPDFETYRGADPGGYALAVNIARRHLTTGARAIIAAKAARLNGATYKSVSDRETKLTQTRLSEAVLVLDWAPYKADEIIAGVTKLSNAVEEARDRKREAEQLKAKLKRLKASEQACDLAVLVEEKRLDLDEAIGLLDEREEKARQEAEARATEEARLQFEEEAQRESERRAAVTNLNSILTYLVSVSITPAELAERDYAVALDEFKQADLDYAATTMREIAALKER